VLADALSLESVRGARPRRLLEVRAIPGEVLERLRELLEAPRDGAPADGAGGA
jgi:hypothetical protein